MIFYWGVTGSNTKRPWGREHLQEVRKAVDWISTETDINSPFMNDVDPA